MDKYVWIRYPKGGSLSFIYNVNEGYIYDYDWNKINVGHITKKEGNPTALYRNTWRIFCAKDNKSAFYYPHINKVENLYLDIDKERDAIVQGDLCFFNGIKTECVMFGKDYIFLCKEDLFPKKDDIIIKVKYSRLDKMKKIKYLLKQ
jgi:hypothetical protein